VPDSFPGTQEMPGAEEQSVDEKIGIRITTARDAIQSLMVVEKVRILVGVCCCIAILWGFIPSARADDGVDTAKVYQIVYGATLDPKTGQAHASLTIKQPRRLVRSVELLMPSDRYLNIRPSSRIEIDGDRVTWRPLKKGSTLHFDFVIDHRRQNGSQDARITDTWALLKLDYLFPRAKARVVKGATSEATLKLVAPKGWAIETPYGRGVGQILDASNPHRLFDRPLGWLLAGELDVRRDNVGDRLISVASPIGSDLKTNDVLAFVRWNMPSLIEVFPEFPQRLLIVSGSQDMWRGGLSGVDSLYLHSDRPLISGNRTSAMLHEIFHVASGLHGKAGADWIVEGLAEYYSLAILLRSGGISERRFNEAFDTLAQWSAETQCVATDRSQGEQTARATLVMRALDTEIRSATGDKASLDTLVQKLVRANRSVTNEAFRAAAKELIKGPVRALSSCP
jgi:hypothetical protein